MFGEKLTHVLVEQGWVLPGKPVRIAAAVAAATTFVANRDECSASVSTRTSQKQPHIPLSLSQPAADGIIIPAGVEAKNRHGNVLKLRSDVKLPVEIGRA